jgi:trigger factor
VKSAVETLSPTRAKLTVEVPFEELKPSLDKAYKEIAKSINIPGFRKGKVPAAVIERQYPGAARDQALNDILNEKYFEAVQANDLTPLAQPEVEVTKYDADGPLEFTAEVDVKPVFEVPDYAGLAASVDAVAVSDEDVAEQVQALRERFGTLKDVERVSADGDFVVIDLGATKDGEAVEGAEAVGLSYQIGRGGMLDGLDEAVTGLSAGDDKTFTSTLVGGDLVGQDVDVNVKVNQVQEQELPELNDEFAQLASEFDTLAELEDDVRERLGRGKRLEQAAAARDAVLEVLLAQVEIPLPDGLVSDELTQRRSQLEQQLQWAGLTMEKYLEDEEQTVEEFEADLERRVRDAIAAQMLLDDIAKAEEFEVTQNDLTQHILRSAQNSGQDPQQAFNHIQEHPHHLQEYAAEIVRGKALAQIVEAATVTDSEGNVVALKGLLPDGSFADEADIEDVLEEISEEASTEA